VRKPYTYLNEKRIAVNTAWQEITLKAILDQTQIYLM